MNGCEAMEKVANKVTSEVGVGSNKKVFLPKTGELVDATTESYIYQVRLPDALMSQLSFQHATVPCVFRFFLLFPIILQPSVSSSANSSSSSE